MRYLKAQGWLTESERRFLYHMGLACPQDGIILNVGVEYGASVHCLRGGNRKAAIIAVDIIGDEKFVGNNGVAQFIKGDSGKIALSWPYDLDFAFIDGDHTTPGVLRDCVFADYVVPGVPHSVLDLQYHPHDFLDSLSGT